MAFPTSLPERVNNFVNTRNRPYVSSSGVVYYIDRLHASANTIKAFKATDPSASWSTVADTVVSSDTTIVPVATCQQGDLIHVAYYSQTTGVGFRVRYSRFNMATDLWEVKEEILKGPYETGSSFFADNSIDIAVRSDGTLFILYQSMAAVMGGNYLRTMYARKPSGGSWTIDIAVDTAGTLHWAPTHMQVSGPSPERVHLGYMNTSTGERYQRTVSGTGFTLQAAGSAFTTAASSRRATYSAAVSVGGTVKVGFIPDEGSVAAKIVRFDSADAPTAYTTTLDITGTLNIASAWDNPVQLMAEASTGKFHVLITEDASTDIYHQSSTDGGVTWSAATKIMANAGGVQNLRASILTRGGAARVAVTYLDTGLGATRYTELALSAPPIELNGSGSSASTASGTLSSLLAGNAVEGTAAAQSTATALLGPSEHWLPLKANPSAIGPQVYINNPYSPAGYSGLSPSSVEYVGSRSTGQVRFLRKAGSDGSTSFESRAFGWNSSNGASIDGDGPFANFYIAQDGPPPNNENVRAKYTTSVTQCWSFDGSGHFVFADDLIDSSGAALANVWWARSTQIVGLFDTGIPKGVNQTNGQKPHAFSTDSNNVWLFVSRNSGSNATYGFSKWNGSTWSAVTTLSFHGTNGHQVDALRFIKGPGNIVYVVFVVTVGGVSYGKIRTFDTSTGTLSSTDMATITLSQTTASFFGAGSADNRYSLFQPTWYDSYISHNSKGHVAWLFHGKDFLRVAFDTAAPTVATETVAEAWSAGSLGADAHQNYLWSIEHNPNPVEWYIVQWNGGVSGGAPAMNMRYRKLFAPQGTATGTRSITGMTAPYTITENRRLVGLYTRWSGASAFTVFNYEVIEQFGPSQIRHYYQYFTKLFVNPDWTFLDGITSGFTTATASLSTQIPLAGSAVVGVSANANLAGVTALAGAINCAVSATGSIASESVFLLEQTYFQMGTTWMVDFMALVNAERASLGLPALKIVGEDEISRRMVIQKEDIAQAHSGNMVTTRIFAHDSTGFPSGYQTASQRAAKITGYGSAENLQVRSLMQMDRYAGISLPQNDPAQWADPLEAYVFPDEWTPLTAFNAWKNSPGHYANMTRDWDSYGEGYGVAAYSLMGLDAGLSDPTQFDAAETYRWAYLTNNFLILMEAYVEVTFTQQWDNTGAVISLLDQAWSNAAYANVKASHEAAYALRLAVSHQADYTATIQAEHEAPIHFSVVAEHEAGYEPSVLISAVSHEGTWDIRMVEVRQSHEAEYRLSLMAAHEAGYQGLEPVKASHEASFTVLETVSASHEGSYTSTVSLKQSHEAAIVYPTALRTSHEGRYDLALNNRVLGGHDGFYTLLTDYPVMGDNAVVLTHYGTQIRLDDAYVSISAGESAYRMEASISDRGLFARISELDPVSLDFCGEAYQLVITSKSVDRSETGKMRCSITAESPLRLLDLPYVGGQDFTNELAAEAQALVEEALQDTVAWNVVAWEIPGQRLQITNASPLAIAKSVAAAAGALVTSEPDGTAVVRYTRPVNWDVLDVATPDQVYSDVEHNLSASQSYEYREGFNKFRLRDSEAAYGDQIQWELDEGSTHSGVATVYPSPYRSSWTLRTTSNQPVVVDARGEQVREHKQVVEFVGGRASVANPVLSVVSVAWKSAGLGALSFVPYSREITAGTAVNQGYGLAEITYTSKAYEFKVSAPTTVDAAQLIVEEN